MKSSKCSHLRIRDTNDYGIDVEEFIKSIEMQYKIDFRSLPQWENLIKRLHAMTTDLKRKIQDAKRRKYIMMSKIFVEATRDSPFVLTDKLARTRNKWLTMKSNSKMSRLITLMPEPDVSTASETEIDIDEISDNTSTAHHNTEILDIASKLPSKSVVSTEVDTKSTGMSPRFPVKMSMNQHRRISSLGSGEVVFDNPPSIVPLEVETEVETKEWMLLKQTTSVKCFPKDVFISRKSLEEQAIEISIINCSTEYMHIRFMCITEDFHFKTARVRPATPRKLYPGIAISFKFIFKLFPNFEDFTSAIYFRVGKKVLDMAPMEVLHVPITSKFKISRPVLVTEAVYIPPTYLWHIRKGFPWGTFKITGSDDYPYHVHIYKRLVNISKECQDSIVSVDVISPNTESLNDRIEDNEIVTQSKILASLRDAQVEEEVSIQAEEVVALLVEDLIELSLDTFVFDRTYLFLTPNEKVSINVHFTKPERIGSHHCYYDIKFCDILTDELIMTKTTKIFAEVLPHPIQLYPEILDMSHSPVTHGYCEDNIIVKNTHKFYPVTIKFKLTTKMKKMFCITPMEILIQAQSSMNFRVRVCSRDLAQETDELVHFTIKIIVVGDKSVYQNVGPFFYEIIAPCASEFKKIYNEKYFKENCDFV